MTSPTNVPYEEQDMDKVPPEAEIEEFIKEEEEELGRELLGDIKEEPENED